MFDDTSSVSRPAPKAEIDAAAASNANVPDLALSTADYVALHDRTLAEIRAGAPGFLKGLLNGANL